MHQYHVRADEASLNIVVLSDNQILCKKIQPQKGCLDIAQIAQGSMMLEFQDFGVLTPDNRIQNKTYIFFHVYLLRIYLYISHKSIFGNSSADSVALGLTHRTIPGREHI